jgi:hypothetical protein
MRVNLIAKLSEPSPSGPIVKAGISLTVKPAYGLPGTYCYATDCTSLLRMLRRETELHSIALERFERELAITKSARLLGVKMTDKALTAIGYFVD